MAARLAVDAGPRRKTPFYSGLFFQVVVAMIVGGLLGYYFKGQPWIEQYLKPLGDTFIKLVKMIIAPVIFLTISIGIANMRDMGKLGRVTAKALGYFLFFSSLALVVGLIVGNFWQTGAGMNIDPAKFSAGDLAKVADYGKKAEATSLVGFLTGIVPDTLVGAFTSGSILQVVFVSIMFGVGLALAGDRARPAVDIMTSISDGIFKMVAVIMRAAPVGALGAFAFVISSLGVQVLANLIELIAAVYLTSFVFIFGVLGVVGLLAGFNIFSLVRYLKEELFLVLGTSSSESALPALMDKMEAAGCARPVVGLVIPTGYSFNLDGTNIYMTLAALFIAQATNIHLSLEDQLILLGVAMLSSKGAAGVTGGGFIALAATLEQVHSIPLAGMALILGVDRFLAQCRALTNFLGNAIATIVVSRWEGALDKGLLKAAMSGRSPALAAPPIEQDAD
jgi:aerobic C4-dicarboxylate transport protein